VWERTLDTNNGRKKAKKVVGTAAAVGGLAMLIVPGATVVSAGLIVLTTSAGVATVGLELEDRIAREGDLKLDCRLVMDVLQVVAVALPFGTLAKTFGEASLVAKGSFLLCMTGLDIAKGFLIASDVKAQLQVIDANVAVQLAGATSDAQRLQINRERDRQAAEIIGCAVVSGGFLLVSLGHGIKNTLATTRGGTRFKVREPVRQLATQGRERMEQALSTDTFEREGGRVQLTAEECRYLEHEIVAAVPDAKHEGDRPAESGRSPRSRLNAVAARGMRAGSALRAYRSGGRALCGPAGRHQRWQIHETDAPGQPRQDVGEVLARIDAGETTRAKDRVGDCRAFAAGVGPRE